MKWTKPSGATIETNDEPATIAAAESLGWKREKPAAKKPAKDSE
jgi:hypothetical protein